MKVREFLKWVAENEEFAQGGPATGEGRIKDIERKAGIVIPGPLRELYRLADGVELPHGYVPPLSGESSLPEMVDVIRKADLGWDLAQWLPFFDYQTGDYDAIEIKSPKGRVGRLDSKTGEVTDVSASFEDWLDETSRRAATSAAELKRREE